MRARPSSFLQFGRSCNAAEALRCVFPKVSERDARHCTTSNWQSLVNGGNLAAVMVGQPNGRRRIGESCSALASRHELVWPVALGCSHTRADPHLGLQEPRRFDRLVFILIEVIEPLGSRFAFWQLSWLVDCFREYHVVCL